MSRRLVAIVAAVLVAAGCSIGPQAEPQTLELDIDPTALPLGRNEPDPTDDTVDPIPPAREVVRPATLYLVGADTQLVPVVREVSSGVAVEDQLAAVFATLIAGPTDDELERDLQSLVPPTTEVLGVELDSARITLDLSSSFADIGGPSELLAVGQLVLTATTFPGVREFALRLDGADTAIPLPDGALADEAVTLRDFSPLLDPAPPTSTTSTTTTTAASGG